MGKAMKQAKLHSITVVDETFVHEAVKGNIGQLVKQYKISSWGPDVRKFSFLA